MIGRHNRFRGRNALASVAKRNQAFRTEYFVLRYAPNRRPTGFRLAVVVSKKVDKRAVVRNRIRRRLFELFRLNLDASLKADLVIFVSKANLAELSDSELRQLFEPAWRQLADLYG